MLLTGIALLSTPHRDVALHPAGKNGAGKTTLLNLIAGGPSRHLQLSTHSRIIQGNGPGTTDIACEAGCGSGRGHSSASRYLPKPAVDN